MRPLLLALCLVALPLQAAALTIIVPMPPGEFPPVPPVATRDAPAPD